jgi:AraC-like DNA-binding protein
VQKASVTDKTASKLATWQPYQLPTGPLILLPQGPSEMGTEFRGSGWIRPGVRGLRPPPGNQCSPLESQQGWARLATAARFRGRELAKLCRISLRTLQRHFTNQYGTSLGEWMRLQRLELAYARIEAGEPIKFVAFDLGFKQLSHFSRSFKEQYGAPPSAL